MNTIDLVIEKKEIINRYRALLRACNDKTDKKDKKDIRRAFNLAVKAHENIRRKSGEPYSVTFDGNEDAFANARSDGGYDAAYIPSGVNDPNVNFVKKVDGVLVADAAVASAVMAHVNGSGLSSYKGGIVPRNAFNSPWLSSLDLRITQDINLMGDHKAIVYLDITNVLNLIDDDKGIVREYSNRSRQIILDEDNPYDSQGRYNIVGVDPDDGLFVYNRDGQSSYQWNLGFKYQF